MTRVRLLERRFKVKASLERAWRHLELQIWPVLAGWLALTPIEVVRARREDRVLAEAFGAEYREYRSRTWF